MDRIQSRQIILPTGVAIALCVVSYASYRVWWKYIRTRQRCVYLRPSKICVVDSQHEWNVILAELRKKLTHFRVLGLDCEWVSGPYADRRPVSLLQMSSLCGYCVLVRQPLLLKCPASLQDLLTDKSILKVGVACMDDASKLSRDHGVQVSGCVDLRNMALRCHVKNNEQMGLAALASRELGVVLQKEQALRCSDWEAEQLDDEQILYAANDAFAAVRIFAALVDKKIPGYANRWQHCSDELWSRVLSVCQGIIDIGVTSKPAKATRNNCRPSVKRVAKTSRAYSARKTPLYDNCHLLAPDGQLLCTCDMSKASWYLDKGLAEPVCDEPFTVRLTFEPAGRPPTEGGSYYTQERQNMCAVCASADKVIRKSIVPHEYRKFFPSIFKQHRSHDIVLLCTSCHQMSGHHDAVLRQELAVQCDAPISTGVDLKYKQDPHLAKLRSGAKALLNSANQLPEWRREELTSMLTNYLGVTELNVELLRSTATQDIRVENTDFLAHGQKVVEYMSQHGGLMEFEKRWRRHFLLHMSPKHLPELWSVDHSHDQLASLDSDLKEAFKMDKS